MVRNDMQSGNFLYTWNDKAHNAFLDLLVEKGLAGAILFLIVAAVVLRSLWRLSNRHAAYYLAAGLAAYAASIAVSFDTFGSLLGLFLCFAWCDLEGGALPHAPRLAANPAAVAIKNKQKNPSGHRKAASLLIAGACIVGLYLNVEIGIASSGCQEAQAVFLARPPAGFALYQAAFQHFYPYQDKQKLQCAALLVQSLVEGRRGPGDQAKIESALRIGQEAVSAHPLDAYLSLWLGMLHIDLGVNVDKKYLEGGKVFGEKALELSPMRQEIMLHLSRTYRALGESRRAADVNRRMVDADPAYPQAHWYYGLSLIDDHQMEVGKKEVRKALDLGYQPRDSVEAQIVKQLFGS
jgi:tetratricopeptide (TPR) repeat protein